MAINTDNIRYFIYSSEQMNFQKKMAEKMGRKYIVGTVIWQGKRRNYTSMSKVDTSPYSDAEIVAQGDYTVMKYKQPRSEVTKGN